MASSSLAAVTGRPPREVRRCSGGWSLRVLVKGFIDDTGSTLADTHCREDEKHGFGSVIPKLDQSTKPALE